jgi:hypothetical protein
MVCDWYRARSRADVAPTLSDARAFRQVAEERGAIVTATPFPSAEEARPAPARVAAAADEGEPDDDHVEIASRRSPRVIVAGDLPEVSDDGGEELPRATTSAEPVAVEADAIAEHWQNVIHAIIDDDMAAREGLTEPKLVNPVLLSRACISRARARHLPPAAVNPIPVSGVELHPTRDAPSLLRWVSTDWREWALAGRASVFGGLDCGGHSFTNFRHALPSLDGWTREEDCLGNRDWDQWMNEIAPCFEARDADVRNIALPYDLSLRGVPAPLGTENANVIVEHGLGARDLDPRLPMAP